MRGPLAYLGHFFGASANLSQFFSSLRSGGGRGGEGGGGDRADVKSNNPRLTGGEKAKSHPTMICNLWSRLSLLQRCAPGVHTFGLASGPVLSYIFLKRCFKKH